MNSVKKGLWKIYVKYKEKYLQNRKYVLCETLHLANT
jgi:hypothetical protein